MALLVLKTVNRKPICRPKDTDPVTFRFLQTKTGFITYFIILPQVHQNIELQQIFHSIL